MRLIHCADLHLDSRMTSNLSKEKARERKKELLLTFERMVEYAAAHHVEAILIAGDLFDTRNISATARHVFWNAIDSHREIQFFYLKGNHDTDHFMADREEIPENLKLFGTAWTSYPLGSRIVVSALELSEENAAGAVNTLILDPDKFNIVMLHGQQAEAGAKEKVRIIRLRELKNRGIDYLALGHIHSYQEGALDARGAWCYPGCLEGRGFDECGEHGFVLLDVDESSGRCRRQFVPIAGRRLYTIQTDVSGCEKASEIAERIDNVIDSQHPVQKDLIKIVLTGEVDVEDEIDVEYLRKRLEPDYYFVKLYDETTPRVDVSRFLLDTSLKGEFVRTVLSAAELSDEERAEVIRCGLRALAGEEILECV